MMLDHVLKYSLLCVVNGQQYLRMTSKPFLVRCVIAALPVCELTVAISLIKHSVTFKNDPYPVLLHFLKSVLILICKIHRIHCSMNTLKISINKINEFLVNFKKNGKCNCMRFFILNVFVRILSVRVNKFSILSGQSH